MSNEFYSESVFLGQSSAEVFSVLFKFLFSPLYAPGASLACDWLIQHRTMWERTSAPLDNFVACAVEHGMTNTTANVVISDKTSEDKRYPHLKFQPAGCRDGIMCDQSTVESMFALSRCSHAVLTHTSTFGTCISGLWGMKHTYVVKVIWTVGHEAHLCGQRRRKLCAQTQHRPDRSRRLGRTASPNLDRSATGSRLKQSAQIRVCIPHDEIIGQLDSTIHPIAGQTSPALQQGASLSHSPFRR